MIFMLAGTSDARNLALEIQSAGYAVTATVVTESAASSLAEVGLPYLVGRLTADEMAKIITERGYRLVVDASHPFAEEASKNAMVAAEQANVPYIRYERAHEHYADPLITIVKDYDEAAHLAAEKRGVIMLTTGSKTLATFTKVLHGLENTRVIARMLPRLDNMEKCEALGVAQRDIVAIQGPFSKELNEALFRQYDVTVMITKESGKVGSVDEKLEAALACGIETILIARPNIKYGQQYSTFEDVLQAVQNTL
ncbi:precorrin-6A reductase [Lysinibacillus xylanilyticus]|uniref:precorrin-6A reductase n=1 Tax=Lysinibacillus xylanilyticus TaxID=582475 RepID=UPI002B24FA74|nr:precorrin-6A reductase [Lysinibacillus xylanilyticus]MEB2282067.1 precorrin-6A reductase [Lysinibacillus xylanilyticus]